MKKTTLLLVAAFLLSLSVIAGNRKSEKIRVACVGNSVTYGYKLPNREREAYPVKLQEMLGAAYDVQNFGHSGATLLRRGHNPYVRLPEYDAALRFRPDIVVIHLGLNDTDPRNWPIYGDEFVKDYTDLIQSFRRENSKVKIWICLMTPIFHDHPRFDSGTRLWHGMIQKRIRQVAESNDVGLVDLYSPLHVFPNLFPDALHPNPEGAKILARSVYKSLTGNFGGLSLPPTYGSNMVIQRQCPINISGTANAGERVSVNFHGLKATALTNEMGQWETVFPAEEAGGPYTLVIKAKSGEKRYDNVWVGEVWLCSGQSNMELKLPRIRTAAEDLSSADTCSSLHLFDMPSIVPTYAVEWDSARLDSVNRLLYVMPGKWEMSSQKAAKRFSAIGFNYGRMLADSLGCHVGIISNAVGGSGCEDWIDRSTLEEHLPSILRRWKSNDYVMRWCQERAALNTRRSTDKLQRHPYEPAYLFESAMLPLKKFSVRGVLWYQGESNAENTELHERLFSLLQQSWRAFFNNSELPFYFVQLSSIATRPSWPHFRDSQRRLSERLPHTWMAVCSDLGDSLDVHPTEKREVARRLLLSSLCHTYGRPVVSSGPAYCGCEVGKDGSVTLHFDNAEGLRAKQENAPIIGFEIAGKDGLFYPAKVEIVGCSLRLTASQVAAPRAVRYGWQPFTRANLENAQGLPASTFRDEW